MEEAPSTEPERSTAAPLRANSGAAEGGYQDVKPLFEEVVREHADKMYGLACRLLGTDSGAEDLAQECFEKAFRSYGTFRGGSRVETWLYRIMVNAWKNKVRAEKRRKFWQTLPLAGSSFKEEPREPEQETRLAVRQALERLDAEERSLVTLREMEGKSYDEIAVILKIPLGTVKSRLARARESLRQYLSEKTDGTR